MSDVVSAPGAVPGKVQRGADTAVLAVPGVIATAPTHVAGRRVLQTGVAAGWMKHRGVRQWEHEVCVVQKSDLSMQLRQELRVMLPEDLIIAVRHPWAHKAAKASPLVAVPADLKAALVEKGLRVHTIGFDRISGGFFYFAEGAAEPALRLQGDLYSAIAPALREDNTNLDVEACLDGLIDRLLAHQSKGVLSEVAVELADALPRMARPGTEAVVTEEFEAFLTENAPAVASIEPHARQLVNALAAAPSKGKDTLQVPLFGEAHRETQAGLQIELIAGEGGEARRLSVPPRTQWVVTGELRMPEAQPAAVAPAAARATTPPASKQPAASATTLRPAAATDAARKAAEEASRRAAEEAARKRASEEARKAEEQAARKRADEDLARKRAAEEARKAGEQAARRRADEELARKRAAEEAARRAAEQAAQQALAQEQAEEQAAAEKAAAEKAAAEKAAAEKAAAEKAAAEKAAAEKAAAEKAAAEKAAAEKAAAERAAARKPAEAKPEPQKARKGGKKHGKKAAAQAAKKPAVEAIAHVAKPAPKAVAPKAEATPVSVPAEKPFWTPTTMAAVAVFTVALLLLAYQLVFRMD